jgi:hypothetical protein
MGEMEATRKDTLQEAQVHKWPLLADPSAYFILLVNESVRTKRQAGEPYDSFVRYDLAWPFMSGVDFWKKLRIGSRSQEAGRCGGFRFSSVSVAKQ